MMNLLETAGMLKDMPDEQLAPMAKANDPNVPQYLVLSELQRRKQMRENPALNPAGGADRTSVADELMSTGIAATPQMSQGAPMPEEQQFYEGGIVGYAGGGEVTYLTEDRKEKARRAMEAARANSIHPWLRKQVSYGKEKLGDFADWAGELQQPVQDYMGARAEDVKTLIHGTPEQRAADRAEYDAAEAERRAKNAGKPSLIPSAAAAEPMRIEVNGVGGSEPPKGFYPPAEKPAPRRGGGRAHSPIPGLPMAEPAPAAAPEDSGIAGALKALQAPKPTRPELASMEDIQADVDKGMPDSYSELLLKNDKRKEGLKGRKNENINMALMQAGLGMMASKNSSFLGSVAEGGTAGLGVYAKGMQDVRGEERDIDLHGEKLQIAQDAAKGSRFKEAADIKRSMDKNSTDIYKQEYTAWLNDKRDELRVQLQDERLDRQERMQLQSQEAMMTRMLVSQDRQDGRADRRAAASGGGGSGKQPPIDRQIFDSVKAANPSMPDPKVWEEVQRIKGSGRAKTGGTFMDKLNGGADLSQFKVLRD